MVEKIFI